MAKTKTVVAGAEPWNADRPPPSDYRVINLALQGGGAHGAFTGSVPGRGVTSGSLV